MTRLDLIKTIALRSGYDRQTIERILLDMMDTIRWTVAHDQDVFLRGFGTFTTKTRKAKYARNIKQNTSCFVPEHKIVYFKPAPDFSNGLKKDDTLNK